ncbi:MAG TPA: hypothetical protein VG323_15465 [Thermoanaerobaculia bacterium]|nr:hypothetical protein [Thermoanaerobaculia bacterium]
MRAAATALVAVACLASLFLYRDFETAFGRRFIEGYHVHHRVEHSIGAFEEPPVLVVSTHAKHWYGVAAIWAVRVLYAAALFGLPLLTWRAMARRHRDR